MTFSSVASKLSRLAVSNSPKILTSLGVVGTITTAYLAGKASFEAADLIRLKEADDAERGEEYLDDPREQMKRRVQLVWRLYVPSVAVGTATVACIIGANTVGARRAAGLAAAYSISEKAFEEYKEKVVEKLGERKEAQIHDEIAQERMLTVPLDETDELMGLADGELCYDLYGDRYFKNTVEGIRAAENDFNHNLIHNGYGSLAELYGMLGLAPTPYAEQIGWNSDRLVDIRFSSTLARNDKPCITISFKKDPEPDYGRFH